MRDPEYRAMRARQEAERVAAEAMLYADEREMLAELAAVGEAVGSVYDFVNRDGPPNAAAITVLCKHLSVPHHHRIMDGIVRSLTVPEARGEPARQVLAALKRSTKREEEWYRWAIFNSLTEIGDSSMLSDIEAFDRQSLLPAYPDRIVNAAIRACQKRKPAE